MSRAASTTLDCLKRRFDEVLPPGPHGYFSGGAADERTLSANQAAWEAFEFLPSVMVDVALRDTGVEILGRTAAHPLIAAPTAYQALAHADGESAAASGCAQTQTPYTLSTLATSRPGEVARAVPTGSKWFQIYVFRDRGVTNELIAEAVDNGFEALVLTVDLPVLGRRDRDIKTSFEIGEAIDVPGVKAAGVTGRVSMQDTADLIDPSLTWADVEALAAGSDLPILVKGIVRPDDAVKAHRSGAAGVVVSNHGGRKLDGTVPTARALPDVADAVAGMGTLIVDGGIRRGTDVVAALAMGADAVMVGRPLLWGLAANGAAGVATVFEILLDELDRALALIGCPNARELKGRDDLLRPLNATLRVPLGQPSGPRRSSSAG